MICNCEASGNWTHQKTKQLNWLFLAILWKSEAKAVSTLVNWKFWGSEPSRQTVTCSFELLELLWQSWLDPKCFLCIMWELAHSQRYCHRCCQMPSPPGGWGGVQWTWSDHAGQTQTRKTGHRTAKLTNWSCSHNDY